MSGERSPEATGGGGPPMPDLPALLPPDARLGLTLFFAYLALYVGFIALSAFAPDIMASAPFGGVNLAVLYGIGLILVAVALALVYMLLRKSDEPPAREGGPGR